MEKRGAKSYKMTEYKQAAMMRELNFTHFSLSVAGMVVNTVYIRSI